MRVENLESTIKMLKLHSEEIKHLGVKRLGVFGSLVRNELREDSDIDIVVEFHRGKKTFRKYMSLNSLLEKYLSRKIDLLTPESIDPLIKPYIDKEIRYERF